MTRRVPGLGAVLALGVIAAGAYFLAGKLGDAPGRRHASRDLLEVLRQVYDKTPMNRGHPVTFWNRKRPGVPVPEPMPSVTGAVNTNEDLAHLPKTLGDSDPDFVSVWDDCCWISWSDDPAYERYGILLESDKGWSWNPEHLSRLSVKAAFPRKGKPAASWPAVYYLVRIDDGIYSFYVKND